MNTKLHNHVEILFAAAPKTARTAEMKEELLVNLNEKYDDLLRNGYDTTTAFHIALSGIGDTDELFKECGGPVQPGVTASAVSCVPKAVSISVAQSVVPAPDKPSRLPVLLGLCAGLVVGLPVLAPGVLSFLIIGTHVGLGIFCLFLCIAVAVGLFAFAVTYAITYVIVSLCSGQNRKAVLVLATLLLLFFLTPLFLFLALGVAGAVHDGIRANWHGISFFDKAIVPTGPVVIQEREIGDFAKIHVFSTIPVLFKPSDHNSLAIETHEDMMSSIITEIQEDTLSIRQKSGVRYHGVQKSVITVYGRNIPKEFVAFGASSLTCNEPIQVEGLSLHTGGASSLHFANIESTGRVDFRIAGASNITIAGKAESVSANVVGASNLFASHFETDYCDATLVGASNAEIGHIGKELSVHAAGVCRFSYKGNPTIKKQDVTGASRVSSN